jgi:hypothetical protein
MPFTPKIDTLTPPERFIWPVLRQIPDEFTLYGDLAISLRYGNRIAYSFQFFSHNYPPYDIIEYCQNIPFIKKWQFILI